MRFHLYQFEEDGNFDALRFPVRRRVPKKKILGTSQLQVLKLKRQVDKECTSVK